MPSQVDDPQRDAYAQRHTGDVGLADEHGIMETACDTVSAVMRERGTRSCVYGVRLLCDLLRQARAEHSPVAVRLTISDPDATAGKPGRVQIVGDGPGTTYEAFNIETMDQPGAFRGHLVAIALAAGSAHLLDPTVFQVDRFWDRSPIQPPASSIVLKLDQEGLELRSSVTCGADGWSYEYEPTPHVDWTERKEWVAGDRFRLHEVVRRRFTERTGITFSDLGRNDRCSCGSGRKYKHCCIDSGYFN